MNKRGISDREVLGSGAASWMRMDLEELYDALGCLLNSTGEGNPFYAARTMDIKVIHLQSQT